MYKNRLRSYSVHSIDFFLLPDCVGMAIMDVIFGPISKCCTSMKNRVAPLPIDNENGTFNNSLVEGEQQETIAFYVQNVREIEKYLNDYRSLKQKQVSEEVVFSFICPLCLRKTSNHKHGGHNHGIQSRFLVCFREKPKLNLNSVVQTGETGDNWMLLRLELLSHSGAGKSLTHSSSHNSLPNSVLEGLSLKFLSQARTCYRSAANHGHYLSQLKLENLFLEHYDQENSAVAEQFYALNAENSCVVSAYLLGKLLAYSRMDSWKDDVKARQSFHCVHHKHRMASLHLAFCHYFGWGSENGKPQVAIAEQLLICSGIAYNFEDYLSPSSLNEEKAMELFLPLCKAVLRRDLRCPKLLRRIHAFLLNLSEGKAKEKAAAARSLLQKAKRKKLSLSSINAIFSQLEPDLFDPDADLSVDEVIPTYLWMNLTLKQEIGRVPRDLGTLNKLADLVFESLDSLADTVPQQYSSLLLDMLKQLAEGDVPRALFRLGLCNFYGIWTPRCPQAAADCFRKSAQLKDNQAQVQFAYCLMNGVGVEMCWEKAMTQYSLAASNGNDAGALSLAEYYHQQASGLDLAAKWYERAAALGNLKAEWILSNRQL